MSTQLERIAAKARDFPKLQFTSLAHHITPELLWESLKGIPNKTSVGTDGIDVKAAKKTFETWSMEMIAALHRQGYRAPPAKRIYIPKLGKPEKRPINIPPVIDRVLQGAVSKVLNSIYEQDFLKCSFGGRPKIGAHNAVATVHEVIARRKVNWVFEADLKNFFGSLNHGWVERFLKERVGDPRIITLIRRWLKTGHVEVDETVPSEMGTPQGGPVSVVISNIYLHYVLDLWIEKVVKPRMTGEVYYVRYLDDFILCFQHEADIKRFARALPKRLEKFGLALEPSKTGLVRFGRFAQTEAKRCGEKLTTFYFLGFTFYNSKGRRGHYKVGMKTEKTRVRRGFAKLKQSISRRRHLPLKVQCKRINEFLRGTYRYYGVIGNYTALKNIYYYAVKYWRKCLSSRSQKGRVNWEKYRKILDRFHIQRPKIQIGFNRLSNLALL